MGSMTASVTTGAVIWIGAAGALVFVLVASAEGWTRRRYSSVRQTVSALALGGRGWVQTANFIVSGGAVAAGAVGVMMRGSGLLLGASLLVFGCGLLASGVFPMDPMRGYPPGAPEGDPAEHTVRHRLHDHAGAVVFFSLPVIAALAAFSLPGLFAGLASAAVAAGLLAGLHAFSTAWERDSPRTGLVQRAVLMPGLLWIAFVFAVLADG